MTKHGFYPRHRQDEVDPSPSFPTMEASTLAFWASDDTFRKSVQMRDAGEHGSNEFVFYDGPPFANGLPHYGHLLTGYVKDVVGRYQTMKGHRVERRFGWDTHGLPAELEAQRQLGIEDVTEITREAASVSRRSTRPAVPPSCATRRNGKSTSPARLAGWTLSTTTRHWTSPTRSP